MSIDKMKISDLERKFGRVPYDQIVLNNMTRDSALQDFQKLRSAEPQLNASTFGMKANGFCANSERYKTSVCCRAYKNGLPMSGVCTPSFHQMWLDKDKRQKTFQRLILLYKRRSLVLQDIRPHHILSVYALYYQGISLFRPMVAKFIYDKYSLGGRILDFSSGWGGRLLGALACDKVVSYVGIDTNKTLKRSYDCITKLAASCGVKKRVKILFQPAEKVDFAKLKPFDCVLTSPPYYGIENYNHMPQYKSFDDWFDSFLCKTLLGVVRNISPGGVICINIRQQPTEERMVKFMVSQKWNLVTTLQMPIRSRNNSSKKSEEPIYVFRKSK